jgi:hypothetical protein
MLSSKEKQLIEHINQGQLEEVRLLLNDPEVNLNHGDDEGMSPLMHAVFKGHYEMVRMLIERGADVNFDEHPQKYTALMFAAIRAHPSIVNLLLESGANAKHLNSLNRTASQMAAFVGQHEIVAMIGNFTPIADLEYYTKVHGLETEPKLKKHLLKPLNELLRKVNINPVRVLIELNARPELVDDLKSIGNVLESMCDKEMLQQSQQNNEPFALKLWHLSQLCRFYDRQLKQSKSKCSDQADGELLQKTTEKIVKHWLDGRQHNGFPVRLEEFLRNTVREFKYRDCALFIGLVQQLASIKIGDEPSALSRMMQSINGQKGFADEEVASCSTCGELNPPKKCAKCKYAAYCDPFCQRCHWPTHRLFCDELKQRREMEEIEKKLKEQELKDEEDRLHAVCNMPSVPTESS